MELFSKRLIGRLSDLKNKVGSSSNTNEDIYKCPYCITLRGKEDTRGKLYFNTKTGQGFCHLCETPVFDDSSIKLEEEGEEYIDFLLKVDDEKKVQEYNLNWTLNIRDVKEVHDYLLNRNITNDLIDRYQLRACTSPVTGVVVPNKVYGIGKNLTDFFQIRDINSQKWLKYINPLNSDKPLYGTDFIGQRKKAFIAEGVFSAIAASSYSDDYAGLCTYGMSIQPEYIRVLRNLPIDEYTLIFDGGELWSILKAAKSLIKTNKRIKIVFLPFKKDPNSVTDTEWRESVTHMSLPYTPFIFSYLFNITKRYKSIEDKWNSIRYEISKIRS